METNNNNQRKRKQNTTSDKISLISVLFTAIAIVYGLLTNPVKNDSNNVELKITKIYDQMSRNAINELLQYESLRSEIDSLKRGYYKSDTLVLGLGSNLIKSQVGQLLVRLDSIEKRFTKIESIIINSPSDALEIPLMKREIEDIRNSDQAKFDNLNKDIERAYNIILVSLAGLAVSVFAPVLSTILQGRRYSSIENKESKVDKTE